MENGAIPGEARILLKVTNQNDATDTLSGIYLFNVVGEPIVSTTNDLELQALSLFPNPTNDYFELSTTGSNLVDVVQVHNILGRQVRQYLAAENRFDVADLPKGMYLVSLMDEQEGILKTLRLQKR